MAKPTETDPARVPARIMVVTGTRAEFGLLTPVMRAVEAHPALQLQVVAAGSHLVPPALTFRDVKAVFDVVDSVPMQRPGHGTRLDDAEAVGRGMARFARTLAGHEPDWVVVLGDRIEAFAAASAASLAGVAVAHIHGGDRAEGIADEA
ncbi:MAG: UDP-N-acetylglucosamine 2-epimerase, partial [Planctomycetota bacterium]